MDHRLEGTCPVCHQGDLISITMNVSANDLAFTTCHLCEAKWWYRDGETMRLQSVIGSVLQQKPDGNAVQYDAVTVSPHRELSSHLQGVRRPRRRPRRARRGDRAPIGSAFAEWAGADASPWARTAARRPGARRRPPRRHRLARDRRARPRARLHGPAVLRVRLARRRRGHAHGQPQPARVQRHEVLSAGARPVGEDTGLAEIRELAERARSPRPSAPRSRGAEEVLEAYVEHVLIVRRRLIEATP